MTRQRPHDALTWWLVLVVVVAVVLAGGTLVVRRVVLPASPRPAAPPVTVPAAGPSTLPAPRPTTLPVEVRPAGPPLLPGAGRDVVVVQTATAVYRLELRTGRVARTPTPDLEQFSSFVAGRGWVVFKTIDNDPGVVVRAGHPAEPLPPGLRPNGRLYLTSRDRLWLVPEDATAGARTVIQVDRHGRRIGTSRIWLPARFGTPISDLAGGLLVFDSHGSYRATPSGVRRLGTGQLLAVGPHHLLTWDCAGAHCHVTRLARSTGRASVLTRLRKPLLGRFGAEDLASASGSNGIVSPDGRHAALELPNTPGLPDWTLAVLDLPSGRIRVLPGSLTDVNPNAQYAWTADSRFLLALTDARVRAYDTRSGRTRTVDVTGDRLLHLTIEGRAGN